VLARIDGSNRSLNAGMLRRRDEAWPLRVVNQFASVDEFRNYLQKRGDNARDTASAAQASGRRTRQGASESQKATTSNKKDALEDALGDLNRSTNRLRRKFDPIDKWIETKSQVEKVVDDGRKINQAVARGSYGAEAARLWAVLRTGINDLARAYGVPPMAI